MKDYVVAEIQPKDGVLKGVHEEMIGRPAYIIELEIGYPGVLKVLPEYDDRYHTIRTTRAGRCGNRNKEHEIYVACEIRW